MNKKNGNGADQVFVLITFLMFAVKFWSSATASTTVTDISWEHMVIVGALIPRAYSAYKTWVKPILDEKDAGRRPELSEVIGCLQFFVLAIAVGFSIVFSVIWKARSQQWTLTASNWTGLVASVLYLFCAVVEFFSTSIYPLFRKMIQPHPAKPNKTETGDEANVQ
jgi:glucan phosphoethanolaminetransferase (alkaline phosphatase superfamily)